MITHQEPSPEPPGRGGSRVATSSPEGPASPGPVAAAAPSARSTAARLPDDRLAHLLADCVARRQSRHPGPLLQRDFDESDDANLRREEGRRIAAGVRVALETGDVMLEALWISPAVKNIDEWVREWWIPDRRPIYDRLSGALKALEAAWQAATVEEFPRQASALKKLTEALTVCVADATVHLDAIAVGTAQTAVGQVIEKRKSEREAAEKAYHVARSQRGSAEADERRAAERREKVRRIVNHATICYEHYASTQFRGNRGYYHGTYEAGNTAGFRHVAQDLIPEVAALATTWHRAWTFTDSRSEGLALHRPAGREGAPTFVYHLR